MNWVSRRNLASLNKVPPAERSYLEDLRAFTIVVGFLLQL
jgi:hypothetical protein